MEKMSNLLFFLLIFITIITLRFIIKSIIQRKFGKDSEIHNSFKLNSLVWILCLLIYLFLELIKYFNPSELLISNLTKLNISALIVSISHFISSIIVQVIKSYSNKIDFPKIEIFFTFIKIVMIFIGVSTGLWYVGIPLTPLLTTVGIGGVAISLSIQKFLYGFLAGLNIISTKCIQKGDFIKVNNFEGKVEDINWFITKLVSRDGNLIVMPNFVLADSVIVNYSKPDESFRINITIPPRILEKIELNSLEKLENVIFSILEEISEKYQVVNSNFKPYIDLQNYYLVMEITDKSYEDQIVNYFYRRIFEVFS